MGTGRVGTVYLAVHIELEEYRAIKRVPKTYVDYSRFKQEALLLKGLRHWGIPIIYDLEEDSEFSYLIEEYLEGESFYDLICREGHQTATVTIQYGIQICKLVSYLHSVGDIPILHLDLQPKNLLLCHDTVKLIDFDHSAPMDRANASGTRYGTIGCAAPEQYKPESILDQRTDIYAIGAVLTYLGTGKYPAQSPDYGRWPRRLRTIIKTCLEESPRKRYQTVERLLKDLESLSGAADGVPKLLEKEQISSLTIALAGSRAGVGTTHLSIGLSAYLQSVGFPNLYEEHNQSGDAVGMGEYYKVRPDRYGVLRVRGCKVKPCYGETVDFETGVYPLVIQDWGTDLAGLCSSGADWKVLVCPSSPWGILSASKSAAMLKGEEKVIAVFNHMASGAKIRQLYYIGKKYCLKMPWQPDPFLVEKKQKGFYQTFIRRMGIEEGDRPRWRFLRNLVGFFRRNRLS